MHIKCSQIDQSQPPGPVNIPEKVMNIKKIKTRTPDQRDRLGYGAKWGTLVSEFCRQILSFWTRGNFSSKFPRTWSETSGPWGGKIFRNTPIGAKISQFDDNLIVSLGPEEFSLRRHLTEVVQVPI